MGEKSKLTKGLGYFVFAILLIAIYKLLDNFSEISNWVSELLKTLMPFFMGILVAYLFYIPVKKIETLFKQSKSKFICRKSRPMSIFVVYIIALLIIIITVNFVLPAISKSIIDFANNLPTYYENIIKLVEEMPQDSLIKKEDIQDGISKIQQIDFTQFINVEKIIDYIKGVMGIASAIFSVFVTVVMSIYILAERTQIINFIRKFAEAVVSKETFKMLSKYFAKSNEIFFRFVYSQIIDGIIIGVILVIAMSIMGVKYSVLLGFLIGLFNIIPYFGAIIAVGIAILITIFTGGIGQAVWVAVVVIILQQIDANIINPKIVGNSLKLSPILVIFSVTIGGAYFGILGMFLAVPIMAVIKLIIIDYIENKKQRKELEENG